MNNEYTMMGREQAKPRTRSALVFTLWLTILVFSMATESFARSFTFTWSANPEPVEGYKLYYKKGDTADQPFDGTGAVEGASPINIGKQITCTITGLDDNATYHFALTAYNGTEESSYSETVTSGPSSQSAPVLIQIKNN